MNETIYDLSAKMRELLEVIEEAEGEITPEVDDLLRITEEQLGQKIMDYYSVIQTKKGNNSVVDDEIDRLRNRKEQNDKIIKRLSSKIFDAVNEFGYVGKTGNKKVDLETLKLWTVSKEKVEIEDEEAFNDPRFCYYEVKLPTDVEFVKKVMEFATSIYPDKEYLSELNQELRKTISRTRLKNALELRKRVDGAKLVDSSFVVMR